jgi:hypothetical protein
MKARPSRAAKDQTRLPPALKTLCTPPAPHSLYVNPCRDYTPVQPMKAAIGTSEDIEFMHQAKQSSGPRLLADSGMTHAAAERPIIVFACTIGYCWYRGAAY